MKIRFCQNSRGKNKIIHRLEEKYFGLDIKVKGCIGKCGACAEAAIAKVDGEVLVGIDSDDLYHKLVDKIEKD